MKRYAIVGTGSRAGMFVEAIGTTYRDVAQLVALCDVSQTRMNWYNQQLQSWNHEVCPTYPPNQFDQMIADTP
jgi:predicted dehydrogenase